MYIAASQSNRLPVIFFHNLKSGKFHKNLLNPILWSILVNYDYPVKELIHSQSVEFNCVSFKITEISTVKFIQIKEIYIYFNEIHLESF